MTQSNSSRRHDSRLMMIVLTCAAVLAFTSLAINAITWVRLHNSIRRQHSATSKMADWHQLLGTILDVELGARGFLISGDDRFLDVYGKARETFSRLAMHISSSEEMEPWIREKWTELVPDIDALLASSHETVVLRNHSTRESSEEFFRQGKSADALQNIRSEMSDIIRGQEASIEQRSDEMRFDLQAGVASSTATGIFALGLAGIGIILLRRMLREMDRSERFSANIIRSERARKQKDAFVAMMSHEIRTPLNAIIGFSQLLEQEAKSPTTRRYAQAILAGGNALLQLINDVLDLSKLEAGMMRPSLEPTDLREMVSFCERLFREQCASKGIRFESDFDDGIPSSLLLDAVRLRQVLLNLLGNAVKFTEHGTVGISVRGNRNASDTSKLDLTITIHDSGPGIPSADQEKIFEPFVQSPENESQQGAEVARGTGLGLAIVKRFLEMMGGRIELQSEMGEGTIFRIHLPSVGVSARVATRDSMVANNVDFDSLKPARIVAADDNSTNRELFEEIFRGSGHELIIVSNGLEACEAVERERPDMVFLDIRMPVMDGLDAVRRIRQSPDFQALPIVAVTAGSLGDEVGIGGAGHRFDAWLRKPFTRKELFDHMAAFLPRRGDSPEITPSSEEPEPTPEARATLRRLLNDEWPRVQGRMSMAEVGEFANTLQKCAEASHLDGLGIYADKLQAAVASFAVQDISTLLDEFPALAERYGVSAKAG